jgi:hypothetical protein
MFIAVLQRLLQYCNVYCSTALLEKEVTKSERELEAGFGVLENRRQG